MSSKLGIEVNLSAAECPIRSETAQGKLPGFHRAVSKHSNNVS